MRAEAVVIGAGHNGLTAAAYLARAGLRTIVLERREIVGGACVSEELWPGYRVSRAAYVAGLLRPAVLRELALERRGLRLLPRDPSSWTPLPDGRELVLGPDRAASCASIAGFSATDARRYPDYETLLDRTARAMEPWLDVPPPDPARLRWRDVAPLLATLRAGWHLRRDLTRASALLLGAARPVLETWFESEPLRSTLATDALIGAWAGPTTPAPGYVRFPHVMGSSHGARGVWAYVEGGMGRLSDALADAARAAGAEIRTGAPVRYVRVRDGRAAGVVLDDGAEIESPVVVSGADPRHTLLDLVGRDALPGDCAREVAGLDFRSPSLKINLALDRLPRFGGRDGARPEHAATIHLGAADLDALEASYRAAEDGAFPERPMIEMTLPSAVDPSVAPPGRHLASLFVQHVPHRLNGTTWDVERDRFADRVSSLVDEVAPGFSDSVLHREVLAPPDLARLFGLSGGNLFHGAMTLDRLLFLRPWAGAGYGTPIAGLYLCGAGTHPGGGVMGACGRNAAGWILAERRRRSRGGGAS